VTCFCACPVVKAVRLWVASCTAQAAEAAFRKAERALEAERRSVESAEKAAAAAEKRLEKCGLAAVPSCLPVPCSQQCCCLAAGGKQLIMGRAAPISMLQGEGKGGPRGGARQGARRAREAGKGGGCAAALPSALMWLPP
jgi:Tfp pilus assembly protein PilX